MSKQPKMSKQQIDAAYNFYTKEVYQGHDKPPKYPNSLNKTVKWVEKTYPELFEKHGYKLYRQKLTELFNEQGYEVRWNKVPKQITHRVANIEDTEALIAEQLILLTKRDLEDYLLKDKGRLIDFLSAAYFLFSPLYNTCILVLQDETNVLIEDNTLFKSLTDYEQEDGTYTKHGERIAAGKLLYESLMERWS